MPDLFLECWGFNSDLLSFLQKAIYQQSYLPIPLGLYFTVAGWDQFSIFVCCLSLKQSGSVSDLGVNSNFSFSLAPQ